MIALDTNILVDIDEADEARASRAFRAVESVGEGEPLVVCAAVYAELCAGQRSSGEDVLERLRQAQISIETELSIDVWSAAGAAFAEHARRRHATAHHAPRRILADFIIGAHAQTVGTLVTNDAAFFRRAFPRLRVVDPADQA